MDNYKTPIYDLSLMDLKQDGGYYDMNGLWNAVFITDDNLILRDRVETFIFKIEDNVLYVYMKMNSDNTYRIPGGSKTKGISDKDQAYLECKEEARIIVSDMEYTGVEYIRWYPDKLKEIKENPVDIPDSNNTINLNQVDWVGTHNSVYIGFYESQYHGIVEKIDKDDDMYKNGNFYPVGSVLKYINENHRPVFDKVIEYFKNSGDGIIVEASSLDPDTQARSMITDIRDGIKKMDNCLFIISLIDGGIIENEDGTYGICYYRFADVTGYYQLRDFLSELNNWYIEKEFPLMFLIPNINTHSGIIVAAKPGLIKESEQIENPDTDMKVVDNHAKTSRFSSDDSSDWSEEVHRAYTNYRKDKSAENKDALLQLGYNPDEGSPENAEKIIAQAESAAITEGVISINEKFILNENEISDEACLDESENEIVDEAYIIDKTDATYNIYKWSTDSKHNILYITGLSGSGKTTFANDIAKSENAEIIELDLFQNYDRNKNSKTKNYTIKLIDEYLKEYPEAKDKDFSNLVSDDFGNYFRPFFKWLRERLSKENKKFIVEGIHILLFIPYSEIEGEPLVCIGTSMTKSLIRHWRRDGWDMMDKIKYGKIDASLFIEWEKQYKNFKSGINESVYIEEASKLPEFRSPEELSIWMKRNISYANFTKLMSAEEVYEKKKGSCHDQVVFELKVLRSMHLNPKAVFLIEYNENSDGRDAMTHSFVYYNMNNKVYWFENAWGDYKGIHEYDSVKNMKNDIKRMHKSGKWGNFKKYPEIEITSFGKHESGETLQELVNKCVNESTYIEEAKSSIDKNYKPKGKMNLSSFKRMHLTEAIIDKYKKEYPFLKHVRYKDTKVYICDGYIWFDDNQLVAMVGSCEYTDDKTKWIASLEIVKKYQGYGLSKQILDYATKSMKCKYLSVNKNNKVAKKVYDDYGFKVYEESDTMYYMTIDKSIKESSVDESKLSSNDRKELPDSVFGLPEKRKYPMPDKKHVLSAIKFFNFVDEEDEKELAKNIKKMMKKYNIDDSHVGKDNRLRKYL